MNRVRFAISGGKGKYYGRDFQIMSGESQRKKRRLSSDRIRFQWVAGSKKPASEREAGPCSDERLPDQFSLSISERMF